MKKLERFDAQSDQKIIALTEKVPSPDTEGYTRFRVTMPWDEVIEGDVDKIDFRTVTAWCEMIRGMVNERYDGEKIAEEQRAARAQAGADEPRGGEQPAIYTGDAEPVAAAVPAPEAGVDEDESPAEVLRRNLLRSRDRLAYIEGLNEEAATLRKKITALTAALEVLDGGEDESEDD